MNEFDPKNLQVCEIFPRIPMWKTAFNFDTVLMFDRQWEPSILCLNLSFCNVIICRVGVWLR